MALEEIFPGICLTLFEHLWTPDKIRAHGFTHIIRIDRHMARHQQQQHHQHQQQRTHHRPANIASSFGATAAGHQHHHTDLNANVVVDYDALYAGFKTLDLNFGEDVYLSSVLPNCYKGVTFIEAALRSGGAVLIIDRLNKQKCITVVIGFLMYKDHIKFSTAFQKVKLIHPNLELDGFYQTQLHEYEPILQVQRTQSFGNSCSRELRCSQAKRKLSSMFDDGCLVPLGPVSPSASSSSSSESSPAESSYGSYATSSSSSSPSSSSAFAMETMCIIPTTVLHDSTCPADILME